MKACFGALILHNYQFKVLNIMIYFEIKHNQILYPVSFWSFRWPLLLVIVVWLIWSWPAVWRSLSLIASDIVLLIVIGSGVGTSASASVGVCAGG